MVRLRRNGTCSRGPGPGETIAPLGSILLVGLAAAFVSPALAQAPIQITPPGQGAPPTQPARPKAQPKAHAPAAAHKSAPKSDAPKPDEPKPDAPKPAEPPRDDEVWPPLPATSFAPSPAAMPTGQSLASAFAAYQRGYYVTAFAEATRLAGDNNPQAMALLGELYSNGAGVPQDYKKATEWFWLAAERGDAAA